LGKSIGHAKVQHPWADLVGKVSKAGEASGTKKKIEKGEISSHLWTPDRPQVQMGNVEGDGRKTGGKRSTRLEKGGRNGA